MYLVVIGWLYVTLLMAIAEASAEQGSLLGAIVTFVLYGLLPMSIVLYILGTPGRKRALRARHQAEMAAWTAAQQPPASPPSEQADAPAQTAPSTPAESALRSHPDTSSHTPTAAEPGLITPVGKKL